MKKNKRKKEDECKNALVLFTFFKKTRSAVCATPKPTEKAGGCPAEISRSLPPLAAETGREVCDPFLGLRAPFHWLVGLYMGTTNQTEQESCLQFDIVKLFQTRRKHFAHSGQFFIILNDI